MPVIDDEETLILEEESQSKILSNDFGKRFTPQQELSAEQAFWLRMSNPTNKPSEASHVKIETPKELPKVSLVNESLKKLKFHLARFDNVVKIRTTPNARTEEFFKNNDLKAQLQDKDSTICKLKDIIKSMREKSKEENVKYDYGDIETKNVELENIKGKEIVDIVAQIPSANTIVPGMFKLDLEPLAPSQQAKAEQPLDKELDFACKHAQRIQELLVYFRDTCPTVINLSAKKVESSTTSDSNTPVLSPTGLKCSTSNCGSKPTDNKKNYIISITSANVVPLKKTTSHSVETQKPELKVYNRKPKNFKNADSSKKAKIVESSNANHSEPNHTWGSNATDIPSFENDNIARIMGYGDYQLGNVTISRVYYVEGLGHNLFSVGQFWDADLEVAFWKNTCFIHNLEGVDLLSGSRDTNLYTISLDDMLKTSLICLLYKASKTKSWLWHHRLSHLNFACTLGKSKKSSHQPKAEDTNQEKLYLLHKDLCGLMCVVSINEKRRNQTLVEVARTMLIFSKAPLFLWAEAINAACYTQNCSLIRLRYNKTLYELMQDQKPDLSFFHVFGALCYPTNDNDDPGKLDEKADIGIFVGYAHIKKSFRIYNKRTQKIIETIHVTFDELTTMASEQFSLGPGLHSMTPTRSSSGLVPNPIPQQPCIPPPRDDWDHLFQPMFDEYFTAPSIAISTVQKATAPRAVVLADSSVSTSIDLDAP
ncbi:retrovirus-related pol polyprotein from transposon TNT 1-94 [Tanacetum coccineum]